MEDTTWIATIAGIALGISIIIAFIVLKTKDETGVTYTYDDQNRIQAIIPLNNNVRLKPM